MSFKCPRCSEIYGTGVAPIKLVLEYRTVVNGDETRTEIAREQAMCLSCAEAAQPTNPEVMMRVRRRAEREAFKRSVELLQAEA